MTSHSLVVCSAQRLREPACPAAGTGAGHTESQTGLGRKGQNQSSSNPPTVVPTELFPPRAVRKPQRRGQKASAVLCRTGYHETTSWVRGHFPDPPRPLAPAARHQGPLTLSLLGKPFAGVALPPAGQCGHCGRQDRDSGTPPQPLRHAAPRGMGTVPTALSAPQPVTRSGVLLLLFL